MKSRIKENITLSPEELEDLKDEIKFRECVMLKLKQLSGVPEKVTILGVMVKIHAWLIGLIVLGILTLAFRVLARQ